MQYEGERIAIRIDDSKRPSRRCKNSVGLSIEDKGLKENEERRVKREGVGARRVRKEGREVLALLASRGRHNGH